MSIKIYLIKQGGLQISAVLSKCTNDALYHEKCNVSSGKDSFLAYADSRKTMADQKIRTRDFPDGIDKSTLA